MTLLLQQAKIELHQKQTLNLPHFSIEPQQCWVVVGSNGSGKSAFALALQNELPLQEGEEVKRENDKYIYVQSAV